MPPPQNMPYLSDGDAGFIKVDTFSPSHELPSGVAAGAINKRFEDGRAWPRFSIDSQGWGITGVNLAAGVWAFVGPQVRKTVTLVPGTTYIYVAGNSGLFSNSATLLAPPHLIAPGQFLATQTTYYLFSALENVGLNITAQVLAVCHPRAFSRFQDPGTHLDTLILVTDDWRMGAGEDGGRGRAWLIASGNAPAAIPLNGHDVWDEARLIPCFNGLELLRQGNERHYFQAAAIDVATSRIQLNCTPAWANADLVLYNPADGASYILGTSPPNPLTTYYVKNIATNKVELYVDAALTTKLDMSGASVGRFYLERQASRPGFYGNGAPPLLMQSDASGATAFQVGFKSVPLHVAATAFDGTAKVLTAPQHRLTPGDKITYTHTTLALETFYVNPVSADALMLYTTVDLALAGGLANAQTPAPGFTAGDYLDKAGASGLPMPPAREGLYLPINRLVVVNQQDTLGISDPLDPLHFTPFLATITANLGEADAVTSLVSLSKDRFVVSKENELLLFEGISQSPNAWQLTNITKEYGWIAPLASKAVGKDAWGLSRKGVVSIFQTAQGELQGLADPVSRPVKQYIDQVDWQHASQACAEVWNNRYFLAVPLKGQSGPVVNNAVLVYNILNQGWEGLWQGDLLQVYCFARHKVFGEERLCFVDYLGRVMFFGEGWTDEAYGGPPQFISDELTTRTYSAGSQAPKVWLIANLVWDTNNPKLTVSAEAPGYNEAQVLVSDQQYLPTKYQAYGQADYDPATAPPGAFDAPYRADYSLTPEELLAGATDIHQNTTEKYRMRINDWGVQMVIANKQGSARVESVEVKAVPHLRTASRQV